ncbi:MAG TPA: LuxR C-terminal-related transcriptional regulator [Longimicrobiales bacterium]
MAQFRIIEASAMESPGSNIRQSWTDMYEQLSSADRRAPLAPADVERLATAAYLIGRDEESAELWTRAHQAHLERGDIRLAVRAAFWLAFALLNRGESARGGGWIGRARRLLDESGIDSVEAGFLLLPAAVQALESGQPEKGLETFARAGEIGERFGDRDLTVIAALHGRGRALIRLGAIDDGVALLDEAMAAVEAGEVTAIVAGFIYCSVIAACEEISDLRRAHEWTAALSDWCESQPELVPYRGQCLVRRAELMQLHGAWPQALREARRASERLAAPPGHPAAESAFYRQAELHRLRGEFEQAEEGYREAGRWSRKPRPGPALLRLAQGRVDAAAAMIRRLLEETSQPADRAGMLPAYVEIMLEAGELDAARTATAELESMSSSGAPPLARAVADRARGALLLAEGDAHQALERLRAAWAGWEDLEAPYEAACTRILIGRACRSLGDEDGAAVELEAARWVFEQVGAAPDVARIDALARKESESRPGTDEPHPLTARELEVLRLLASGLTNRNIAKQLFISERTVERHVSNIFNKLAVTTRAAATAHAYRHRLV